jgi:hypothetical protein
MADRNPSFMQVLQLDLLSGLKRRWTWIDGNEMRMGDVA